MNPKEVKPNPWDREMSWMQDNRRGFPTGPTMKEPEVTVVQQVDTVANTARQANLDSETMTMGIP